LRKEEAIFVVNFRGIFILGTIILSACSGFSSQSTSSESIGSKVAVPGGEYTNVSVDELQEMLKVKDFLFVNVHNPFEGDIPGTDLSIPFDEIDESIGHLPALFDGIEKYIGHMPVDRDTKMVLYCRSGQISDTAAKRMVELGYKNIWNLEGGITAWKQARLSVESE
jgi:rhodanese-related sulfurtransferase